MYKKYSFENISDKFRESLRRFPHQICSTTRPEPVGVNGEIMTDSDEGRSISHARPWLNYDSLPTGEVIVEDDVYMVDEFWSRNQTNCTLIKTKQNKKRLLTLISYFVI